MENKYRLTDEKMSTEYDLVAYRIIALRDFGNVKAGDLGGFVESESNLSHDGNGWRLCDVPHSRNLKLTTTLDRVITQNPCYVPLNLEQWKNI